MSVTNWSPRPGGNAVADPAIPAVDELSGRQVGGALRGIMAGVAAASLDRGGALTTTGAGNTYAVRTQSGLREFAPGLALLIKVDRANTGPASLAVDGLAPRAWLDREGQPLATAQLQADLYVWAVADVQRGAWISDLFGGLTVALFDGVMRNWWRSLPDDPRGLGPNAPWRNGGLVQWTGEDNPAFTIDSPAGRRLTLTLIRDALPTSPDGLAPGDPWLSGDAIAFVPQL